MILRGGNLKQLTKPLARILFITGIIYILLFIVFWFDLDGKLLFNKVEPMLKKHYDNMERRDPLDRFYAADTPDYEYPKSKQTERNDRYE